MEESKVNHIKNWTPLRNITDVMPLTTKLQIPSLDPFEFSLSLLIDGYRCVRYVIKSTAITD